MTVTPARTKLHQNRLRTSYWHPVLVTGVVLFFVVVSSIASADVDFAGLDDRLETNVRALSPLSTTSCDSAKWRVDRLFRDADKTIVAALQALGYYEPVIAKSLRWDEDCWHASFDIQAGDGAPRVGR